MRKRALSCLIAGIMGIAAVLSPAGGGARAENIPYSLSITPFAGGYVFENNQHMTNRAVYGVSIGYNLSEHWALEATYSAVPEAKTTNTNQVGGLPGVEKKLTVHEVRGDILYHFLPAGRFVPYVAAGAGWIFLVPEKGGTDDDILVDYGVGFKYFLNDRVALRADVRHIFDITYHDDVRPQDYYNNFMYTAGVTFQLGGVKPPVRPVAEEKPAEVVAPAPVPAPQPTPLPAPKVEPPPVVVPPAPEKPAPLTVTGIIVRQSAVEITATEPIKAYKTFTLAAPARLVIDIDNAANGFGAKRVPVHAYGIAAIRLEEYPEKLRIVFDAEQDNLPLYRFVETDRGLSVVLEPHPAAMPEASAAQPAKEVKAAAPEGGTTVTAITAERQGVEITTTERPSYRAYTLAGPPRLVIDIANAKDAVGTKRIPVHTFGIAAVRLGSHAGFLRIVLDAAQDKLPAYRIVESDKGLKVDLTAP